MDSTLKLFLIGFAVGIIATIILAQNEDDEGDFIKSFVTKGVEIWHLVFMLILLTTIPFIAIEPLKKRFTRNPFVPFPFLGGYGTGFLLIASIATIRSFLE